MAEATEKPHWFCPSIVLVLNEMVLVLEMRLLSTSTAGAEYEYKKNTIPERRAGAASDCGSMSGTSAAVI